MNLLFSLLLKLFLVLQTLVNAAGGTTVRGGGFGEMAAVMIFQKMELYISPCLRDWNPCGLSASETVLIRRVLESLKSEYESYDLDFFIEDDTSVNVITGSSVGSPIRIRSGAIADQNGLPRSLSEIGTLVLSGLLMHHQNGTQALAEKVFKGLHTELNSTEFGTSQLQWLHVQYAGTAVFDELFVEQKDRSFDLSKAIQNTGLCQQQNQLFLLIQRLSTSFVESKSVILDVKFGCGGPNLGTAKLKLVLHFDESGSFDSEKTEVRAFGIIRP